MRGRKPKPTALHILAGNPGNRPLNSLEPQPSREIPLCPSWLDDVAKEEWNSIVPELHRCGILTKIDGAALAAYCQAYSDLQSAVKALKKGKMITTTHGKRSHPMVQQKNAAMQLMLRFLSEYGMTPSSRSRIKTQDSAPKDDFEEFMKSAG